MILVIVESPAKCKKIEEYLGPGYKCMASFGHLRELLSIPNIEDLKEFDKIKYTIIDDSIKKKQIALIKKEIQKSSEVILATDDDREGEAISWHICKLFGLKVATTKRIIFHEITKSAIQKAIQNPTIINMNIVHAQQTRQILDLLVGFQISPILWQIFKNNNLSAGRCQTPALKLIYDHAIILRENEMETETENKNKIYNVHGIFTNANITFVLNKKYSNEKTMREFLIASQDVNFQHIYHCSQPAKVVKQPPEPLTTSRLQQKASNELHYSPTETMQICQKLYEKGLITYMRTDATQYSQEFISNTHSYIASNYFSNSKTDYTSQYQCYTQLQHLDVQSPHEAIRCTQVSLSFLEEEKYSNIKERKMYKMIWQHTLESCMPSAIFYSITATIIAPNNTKYSYTAEIPDFLGWKTISASSLKTIEIESKNYEYLKSLKNSSVLSFKQIMCTESIEGTKPHYTEARLVQLLEEKNIGRPSTFASLIDKIQDRNYVKKKNITGTIIKCKDLFLEKDKNISEIIVERKFGNENNKLVIQPFGIMIVDFLYEHFNYLFNYEYTKEMEIVLDKICNGETNMYNVCNDCNELIHTCINDLNQTYGNSLQIKKQPINSEDKQDKLLGQYNNIDIYLKKGRYGLYLEWGENTKSLKPFKEFCRKNINTINLDDIIPYLQTDLTDSSDSTTEPKNIKNANCIREINNCISIKKGPKGDYLFYKNEKMKKPKFYDIKVFEIEIKENYKTCDIEVLKSWIKNKYNIF